MVYILLQKGTKKPHIWSKRHLMSFTQSVFREIASFMNFLKFEHVSSQSCCCDDLKMASYLTDMDEIHRIIFEAPDSSYDLWQSSSEDSIRSSRSDSESENAQTTRGSEQQAQFSISGTSRQQLPARRQCQQSLPVQQDPQTEWRPIKVQGAVSRVCRARTWTNISFSG